MKLFTITLVAAIFSGFVEAADDFNEIRIEPVQDVVRTIGGAATLTCMSEAADITNLKWIGPDGNEIERGVDKANDGSLVLDLQDLSFGDNGEYRCSGFSASANSTVAKTKILVIYDKVEFVDTPKMQELTLGETGSLVCNVKGTPKPTVTWLLNGKKVEVNSSEKYFKNGTYLGIRNVSKDDEKTYLCRGRQRERGEREERNIKLTVNVPPKIVNFTSESTVVAGDMQEFQCGASGNPEPTYSWYEGMGIDGAKVSNESVLTLDITPNMSRLYTCESLNKVGSDIAMLFLDIQVKPSFSVAEGGDVLENESASVECVAEGVPTPDVYFYRNDILLEDSSGAYSDNDTSEYGNWSQDRIVTYSGSIATITFSPARPEDNGKYECRAENDAGDEKVDVFLNVKYAPFVKSLSNKWACLGSVPQLDCEFDGNPTPTLSWGRYIPVEGDNGVMAEKFVSFDPSNLTEGFVVKATGRILSLIVDTSVAKDPFGKYVCSANNSIGLREAVAELKEADKPPAPIGVQVLRVTTSGATVTFQRLEPLVPYDSFTVRLESESPDGENFTRTLKPHEYEAVFDSLVHGTEYTVIAESNTCAGTSESNETDIVKFETLAIKLPEPVVIISGNASKNHDEYTVEWKSGNAGGGEFKGIKITLYEVKDDKKKSNRTKVDTFKIVKNLHKDNGSFTIKDLNPDTEYEITVEITNEVGSASNKQRFRTNEKTTNTPSTDSRPKTAAADTKLIIIIIAVLLFLVLIIDISCCVTRQWGLSYCIFANTCGKRKNHDLEHAEEGSAEYRKAGVEESPEKVEVEEEKQPLADDPEPIANGEPGLTKLDPIDEQTPLQNEGATGGQPAATENGKTETTKEQEESGEKADEKADHQPEEENLVAKSTEPSA